jgi:phosphoribosylformylglycinamidine synthase
MRNVAAVGATPHALSDCLCFGNPEKPHQMWEFVEGVRGVADACHAITLKDNQNDPTPIIAGNVSFYNESKNGPIPPSPIVSCLGRFKNVNKAVPAHFQNNDSVILLIGERKNELGGSVYYSLQNELGANVPKPNFEEVKNQIFALTDCIDSGFVLSCHDIADGGVASALAEMTFTNSIGCNVNIESNLSPDKILFSETGGFILEVLPKNIDTIKSVFSNYGLDAFEIGSTGGQSIEINSITDIYVSETKKAWTNGLREKL